MNERDVAERHRVEEALLEREQQYRALFEENHAVMLLADPVSGAIVDANAAAVSFYGYDLERLRLMRMSDLSALPEDLVFEEMRRASEERRDFFLLRHRLASGEVRDVEVYSDPIEVRGRNLLLSLVYDVTESRRAESALREAEVRYRTLVEQLPMVTYIDKVNQDDPTDVVPHYMSPQIEEMLGYTAEDWLADPDLWTKLVHPDDRDHIVQLGDSVRIAGGPFSAEYRMIRRDGRVVWIRESSVLIRDEQGNPRYWQGLMLDVTKEKRAEEELSHRALHDPLTGLPNRDLLYDRLSVALARIPRTSVGTAVLFLDLDRFKEVNDTFGHDVGDRLLVSVARRLEGCLRPADTISRFGGDEFVILAEAVKDERAAALTARRVLEALARPFALDDGDVFVGASIGVAIAREPGARPDAVIRDADIAMYRAKERGRGRFETYEPGMDEDRETPEDIRRAATT